jgi:hypothetical protein
MQRVADTMIDVEKALWAAFRGRRPVGDAEQAPHGDVGGGAWSDSHVLHERKATRSRPDVPK